MVTCTVSPLSRFTAHLLPVYRGLANERVGVFLARRSVQHLVYDFISFENPAPLVVQAKSGTTVQCISLLIDKNNEIILNFIVIPHLHTVFIFSDDVIDSDVNLSNCSLPHIPEPASIDLSCSNCSNYKQNRNRKQDKKW